MINWKKLLENSEAGVTLVGLGRDAIAEAISARINNRLEEELAKVQVQLHLATDKLRDAEDELRLTTHELGVAMRRIECCTCQAAESQWVDAVPKTDGFYRVKWKDGRGPNEVGDFGFYKKVDGYRVALCGDEELYEPTLFLWGARCGVEE